jgi:RDD family
MMKIDRRAVAIALVLGVGCVHFFGGNEVGFLYSHQGEKTRVSSSTHPLLLVWAVMGILFYWFLMRRELRAETGDAAGLLRRFFAFLIDLYFVTLISGGILALVPLLVEARRTGHFTWTFERGYSVASDDYLFFPLSLIGVIIFFLYFAYPLLLGKQSVGDYLLRLRVTPIKKISEGGMTWGQICKRVLYAGIAVGLWPYTLWKRRDDKGRTWYDRASGCDVAFIKYS